MEGSNRIIEQINLIVNTVREIIVANSEIRNITIEEIASACGISNIEVSLCLQLAGYYVTLYRGTTHKDTTKSPTS